MSYSIIGFGKIGQALAKAFARKGINVSVATTREPESFASIAASIGPTIIATRLTEAVKADFIFLAVRFEAHNDVAKVLSSWKGKTIIDTTNTQIDPEELQGLPSSKVIENAFSGSRLVKGFNHLLASVLGQDPAVREGGRRVIFLASDDDDALNQVGTLVNTLGFSPINLGRLDQGGLLVQAKGKTWGHLIFKDLVKFEA